MEVFIAVLIVLVVMIGFFVFILMGTAARIAKFARNNALRQSGVFDELLLSKEKALADIEEKIKKAQESPEREYEKPAMHEGVRASDYLALQRGEYQNKSFPQEYKIIRNSMISQKRENIQRVLAYTEKQNEALVKCAERIIEEMNLDLTYTLSTLSGEEQIWVLREALDKESLPLLDRYIEQEEEFECYEFLHWLQSFLQKNSANILIRTGCIEDDFETLDSRIQMEYDNTVCEGVYMVTKGHVYDFSIRNREIVE